MKTYKIELFYRYDGSIVFLPFDVGLTQEDAEKRKKEYDRLNGPDFEAYISEED